MSVGIRAATLADRPAIDAFASVAVHDTYDSLIDSAYAQGLLDDWWGSALDPDIEAGRVVIATDAHEVVGFAQLGEWAGEPVMWKLYVAPDRRSQGIGVQLVATLVELLPGGTPRLLTEHIVANEDAGRFYEREGFIVTGIEDTDDPRSSFVWRARDLSTS